MVSFLTRTAFALENLPPKKRKQIRNRNKLIKFTFYITFKANNSLANNYMKLVSISKKSAMHNHRNTYMGYFSEYGFCHTEAEFLAKDWKHTRTEVKMGTPMKKFF